MRYVVSVNRKGNHMSTFTGSAVNVYGAAVVASALRLYARTGIKANRAYTPKNMIATASKITGKRFKARDYLGAADAIDAWKAQYMADPDKLTIQVDSFG